ncbi:MAG TPA: SCO family protein [Stellaceae bacterium]|nr:SCO family protein [Stellaceae bacterium]
MRRVAALLFAAALLGMPMGAPRAAAADVWNFAWRPHAGATLPLQTILRDSGGRTVSLRRYFHHTPVILILEYLHCRTLCGVTLQNVVAALDKLPFDAGRDFQFVAISIDPRDTPRDAAAAKAKYLAGYHHYDGAAGIHFLTGSEKSVRPIARAVGFPYAYDPELDEYIHPAGFIIASPTGRISRYILGVAVTPAQLSAAIADAEQDKALSPISRLLLLCHVQGIVGRFTVPVMAAFTIADITAGIALLALFAVILRRRHR